MKKAAAFFISLFCFSPLRAGEQGWTHFGLTLDVAPRATVRFGHETRARKVTGQDPFLKAVEATAGVSLPAGFRIGGGYRRETISGAALDTNESRPLAETGWTSKPAWGMKWDVRLRAEFRSFSEPEKRDHTRFRARTGLKGKADLGGRTYGPFLYYELFADTIDDKINRDRVYAGTDVPLTAHLKFVLMYVRQDTDGLEKDHALNLGLEAKY